MTESQTDTWARVAPRPEDDAEAAQADPVETHGAAQPPER
jgi:hypothetical protein